MAPRKKNPPTTPPSRRDAGRSEKRPQPHAVGKGPKSDASPSKKRAHSDAGGKGAKSDAGPSKKRPRSDAGGKGAKSDAGPSKRAKSDLGESTSGEAPVQVRAGPSKRAKSDLGESTSGEAPVQVRAGGQKKDPLRSRCQPRYFMKKWDDIVKALPSPKHLAVVKRTPFAEFTKISPCPIPTGRLVGLLKRLTSDCSGFRFGVSNVVPFSVGEFSIILGLKCRGLLVDLDFKVKGQYEFVKRCFPDAKRNRIFKDDIENSLMELLRKNDDVSIVDFGRLYVMLVFICVLFPTSNYYFPKALLPYIDGFEDLGKYAWGRAVYTFLVNSIVEKPKYMEGCTYGFLLWVYEHVPRIGKAKARHAIPRMLRWLDPQTRPNEKDIGDQIEILRDDEVHHPIVFYKREYELFYSLPSGLWTIGEEPSLMEPVEENPDDVIGEEEAKIDEEGAESDKTDMEEEENQKIDDEDETYEDIHEEEDKNDGASDEEYVRPAGMQNPEVDEANILQPNVSEPEGDERNEKRVEEESVSELLGLQNPEVKEPNVTQPSVDEEEDERNEKRVEEEEDERNEKRVEEESVSDTVRQLVGEVNVTKATAREVLYPVGLSVQQEWEFGIVQGTGGPQRMKKQSPIEVVDVSSSKAATEKDEEEVTVVLDRDFDGRSSLTVDERAVVDRFIDKGDYRSILWEDQGQMVRGKHLVQMMKGEGMYGGLIDAWLTYLGSPMYKSRMNATAGVLFMSTCVGSNIDSVLSEPRHVMTLSHPTSFNGFVKKLSKATVKQLDMVQKHNVSEYKYIVVPLFREYHWHMLVLDVQKREYFHLNSMTSGKAKGLARKVATAVQNYFEHNNVLEWHVEAVDVKSKKCRQQLDTSLDCGVWVCMFAEALVRDDPDFSAEVHVTGDIKNYRSRVLAGVLQFIEQKA